MAFEEIRNKLGFGCMRLPEKDGVIDQAEVCRMVDAFLDAGCNYFDTAHGYHGGRSEPTLKACLTTRYPRDRYLLTDKLSEPFFNTEADIEPFFESQLSACGVDYFDCYLMHAQCADNYEKYKRCRAYEIAFDLKARGKIRHVGLSFHDKPDVLERILDENPRIEVVQLQFNYLDYDDACVQSRRCYEVCRARGKSVIVMEPVKGGTLARLPASAVSVLRAVGEGSPASFALRFAAGFDGVVAVLSGMSDLGQMRDNLGTFRSLVPLSDAEHAAIRTVRDLLAGDNAIPCTACRYCTDGCPKQIPIPDVFACLNAHRRSHDWNSVVYYGIRTAGVGKAGDCIRCGKCEKACPQHLPIRSLLREAAATFEKE